MARIDDVVTILPLAARQDPTPPAPRPRLRAGTVPGHDASLDGAWWPRSRDAAAELCELVCALELPPGEAVRVTVDADDWDGVPRRLVVGGRPFKVGWLPHEDHTVLVTLGGTESVRLLVFPPDGTGDPDELDALDEFDALDELDEFDEPDDFEPDGEEWH